MREDYLSGDGENLNAAEKEIEKALRPLSFEDFTGQQKVVDNIKVFVQAAKQRNESLDHVLLHGPPGLGKTTLSYIIANELQTNIKITSGPVYWINQATLRDCSPIWKPMMFYLLMRYTG